MSGVPLGKPPTGGSKEHNQPIGAIASLQLTYAAHLDQRRRQRVEGRRGRNWWEWKAAEQRKLNSGDEGDDELTSLESDTMGRRAGSLPSIRENLYEGGDAPAVGGSSKGFGIASGSSLAVPRVACGGVRVLPPLSQVTPNPVQKVTIKSFQQPRPSHLTGSQGSLPPPSPRTEGRLPPSAPPKEEIYSDIVNESGPIYLTLSQEHESNSPNRTGNWKPVKLEIGQYTHRYQQPDNKQVLVKSATQPDIYATQFDKNLLTINEGVKLKSNSVESSNSNNSSQNSQASQECQVHKSNVYPQVADKRYIQSDTDEEAIIAQKQKAQLEFYQNEKQRQGAINKSASTGNLQNVKKADNRFQDNQDLSFNSKSNHRQPAYYQQYNQNKQRVPNQNQQYPTYYHSQEYLNNYQEQQALEQQQLYQQQQQKQFQEQTHKYQQLYQEGSKQFNESAEEYQYKLQQQPPQVHYQQKPPLQQPHQKQLQPRYQAKGTESVSNSPRDFGATGGSRSSSLPPTSPPTSKKGNRGPAGRGSGSLVWVNQPGGGAKLEWVPTRNLSTLKTVPSSPTLGGKGRIHPEPRPIGGGVAGVGSHEKYDSEWIKCEDDGGGGRSGGELEARADATVTRVELSSNPRVVRSGGLSDSGVVFSDSRLNHSATGDSSASIPSLVRQPSPSFYPPSKNAFSSAPDDVRSEGRSAAADDVEQRIQEKERLDEEEGRVVTVAGRQTGQVVRIRVRPEVHAYLQNLPITHSHLPPRCDNRRASFTSANSSASALTGCSEGGGEGSIGYQEDSYIDVVDEYSLLRRAVEDHDPRALQLLAAAEAVLDPDIPVHPDDPESGGGEYPYLKEMKERLLLSRDPPLAGMEGAAPHDIDNQVMEVHQTPVGTVVKLNADGYGSHTSPTHRVESYYTGTLESRRGHEYYPKNAKTSTFITLSLLYATLLVVVCLGFVLSEVLTHNVPLYYYEAYFTYLYGFSILFLLYVFCYLLSDSARDKKPKKNQGPHSGQYNVSEYEYYAYNEKVRRTDGGESSPTQEKLTTASTTSKPRKHKTTDNEHSHGSFFLRIGAIAFGLGTMIYNGLEFGVFFEIPMASPCYQILRGVNPLLQLVFTFMQMYFIFMNARLNIHKFKFLARFGLMHIVATNLCVWVRTLVRESLKEINEFRVTQGHTGEDYMILEGIRRALENQGLMAPNKYLYNLDDFVEMQEYNETMSYAGKIMAEEDTINRTCQRMEIMGSIVSDSAPYLYPFIIEYSLIGASVLYIMWKHIGRNPRYVYDPEMADGLSMASRRCHSRVDCIGASKGLFCGLLVLVATLICLILFFVLIDQEELRMLAIYLADVSHCGIMFFSIIAIFIGFCRVRQLKFFGEREEELDDILLMVSAFGLFAYAVFSTVAGSLSAFTEEPNLLVMVTGILSILQVVIQMVFIKDTQRRQVSLPEHERTKPGRQVVTFLLICNLAMWVIYTFETQKVEANPVQLEFFGKLSWTILLRCTLPLAIFHRFHSSVVLASIWKNSYKTRIE